MVALDAMEKAADIGVLQAELNDFLGTVLKITGSVQSVALAIEAGRQAAARFGVQPTVTVLAHPDPAALSRAILSRQERSPLLEQNVVLDQPPPTPQPTDGTPTDGTPTDAQPSRQSKSQRATAKPPQTPGPPRPPQVSPPASSSLKSPPSASQPTMPDAPPYALGFIETQGFTAVFEAIDTACKAANVEVVAKEKLGGGYVTVVIRGDVAAVNAAIEAGKSKVGELGRLIAAHVIARPTANVMSLLPKP